MLMARHPHLNPLPSRERKFCSQLHPPLSLRGAESDEAISEGEKLNPKHEILNNIKAQKPKDKGE